MLQKPMQGTASIKRKQWTRKHIQNQEVQSSIKKQKKYFKKQVRNGKDVELPRKGNHYKRIANKSAVWEYVS